MSLRERGTGPGLCESSVRWWDHGALTEMPSDPGIGAAAAPWSGQGAAVEAGGGGAGWREKAASSCLPPWRLQFEAGRRDYLEVA